MNKDLAQFENRSDDWLAKERKHEDSVSVWDIDEGKRIKDVHHKNCEAKEIKENHEEAHDDYYQDISSKKTNSDFKRVSDISRVASIAIALCIVTTFLIFAFIREVEFEPEVFIAVSTIIFVIIMANVAKRRKK